jgi:hypothetical protein
MFNSINFQRKKEKILIMAMLGIVLFGGLVIAVILTKDNFVAPVVQVERPQEPQINWGVLEGEEMKQLQSFPEVPDYQGPVGRDNPFLPF